VAESILDDYNSNPPEKTSAIPIDLRPEQIARLNNGETVTLNLMNEWLFFPWEQNVRIDDLRIRSITTEPVGGSYGSVAIVYVAIEHSGISNIKSDGAIHRFRHYNRETQNPIVWGGRWYPKHNDLQQDRPSAASNSLLCSLLSSCADPDDVMLYSRPSAWADLHISREVRDVPAQGIDITSLSLELDFDFTPRSSSSELKDLEVLVTTLEPEGQGSVIGEESTFQPYFMVERPDFNDRQDARGRFLRIYQYTTQPLQVTAQETFGAWSFNKWTDCWGGDLAAGLTIDLALEYDQTICAQYVPMSVEDNCPYVPNSDQADADGNGIGDACQCGDVNGDGYTNVTDALLIVRGQVASGSEAERLGDVNGDTFCNVTDALMIAKGQQSSEHEAQLCPAYHGP
jgi:hypothetical protein